MMLLFGGCGHLHYGPLSECAILQYIFAIYMHQMPEFFWLVIPIKCFCQNLCNDVVSWGLWTFALWPIKPMCNFAIHFCNNYAVIMHQMPESFRLVSPIKLFWRNLCYDVVTSWLWTFSIYM